MTTTMAARIRALQDMTVPELREQYREVFGEETRSRHKEFLWRRIAWRMQANEEGDLSERALRRAAELANDADVRLLPPREVRPQRGPAPAARTRVHAFAGSGGGRLPMPGAVLVREYKGREVRVTVLDEGFEHEGKVHRSLSAVAKEVTGAHWNGFHFFGIARRGATAGAAR